MKRADIATAKLTKEQESCVNYNSGDLLIKGVAGSGKSYVILKRALKLFKEKEKDETVAIFTYTNPLVKYTSDLMAMKLNVDDIEVSTVDSYCWGLYYRITRTKMPRVDEKQYKQLISDSFDE